MQLDTFERCCGEALEKLQFAERGVSKPPTVSEIWDLKRNLRAMTRLVIDHDAPPAYAGDGWDISANLLLLNKVTSNCRFTRTDIDYAPDVEHGKEPGKHTKTISKILTKWKDAWSRDMREDRELGGKRDGKPDWLYCMEQADKEVVSYLIANNLRA